MASIVEELRQEAMERRAREARRSALARQHQAAMGRNAGALLDPRHTPEPMDFRAAMQADEQAASVPSIGEALTGAGVAAKGGIMQTLGGAYQMAGDLGALPGQLYDLTGIPKPPGQRLIGRISGFGRGLSEEGARLERDPIPGKELPVWARGLASAGQIAPNLAVNLAAPGLGLPTLIGSVTARGYGEARREGEPIPQAIGIGAAKGAVEYGTQRLFGIPFDQIFKRFGRTAVKQGVKWAVNESGQELSAEALDAAVDKLSTRPDMTLDEFAQRMKLTAQALPFAMAATGAMVKGSQAIGLAADPKVRAPEIPRFITKLAREKGVPVEKLAEARGEWVNKFADEDHAFDSDMQAHELMTGRYMREMGEAEGLPREQIDREARAMMTHDTGKRFVSQDLLHAPRRITSEERAAIRKHTDYGAEALRDVPGEDGRIARDVAFLHHDPDTHGVEWEALPDHVKRGKVVDVFDALTNPNRNVYRQQMSEAEAFRTMAQTPDLDPQRVKAFAKQRLRDHTERYSQADKVWMQNFTEGVVLPGDVAQEVAQNQIDIEAEKAAGRITGRQAERLKRQYGQVPKAFKQSGGVMNPFAMARALSERIDQRVAQIYPDTRQTYQPRTSLTPDDVLRVPPTQETPGLNIDKIVAPQDVTDALTNIAQQVPEINEARRIPITWDETEQMARDLNMSPADLEKGISGGAFDASQLRAAQIMLRRSAEVVTRSARQIARDGGSPQEMLAFQATLDRHVLIQETVAAKRAEAGRALQILRRQVTGDEANIEGLRRVLEQQGGPGRIEDIAEKIDQLATANPDTLGMAIANADNPSVFDKFFEVWVNGLLSNPTTHVVNFTSNAINTIWSMPEQALAAGIGKLHGGDKVYMREVMPRAFGLVRGTQDALWASAYVLKTGDPIDPATKLEVQRRKAIKGPLGAAVRTPGLALTMGDEFFKALNYRVAMNQLATREGVKQGLKGKDLAEFRREMTAKPTDKLHMQAIEESRYLTFTNELGRMGKAYQSMVSRAPALRLITPFIRTPVNIAKFGIERSPLAPLMPERFWGAIKQGGAARDTAIARMALGSLIGAAVAEMAANGLITGGGPEEYSTRTLWLQNNQPYSVKLGDKWYAYGRLEPLGMVMGMAADYADISGRISNEQADNLSGMIAATVTRNLTSKTFLRGLSEAVRAIHEPERYGEHWVRNFARTAVPRGVAQASRVEDPTLRETDVTGEGLSAVQKAWAETLNAIKRDLPGYSQDMPPMRQVIGGQPVVLSGGWGPDMVSPIYMQYDMRDPVVEELINLDVGVKHPRPEIGGVELDTWIYDELKQKTGELRRLYLDTLMQTEAYAMLPTHRKESEVRKWLNKASADAQDLILSEYPVLMDQMASKRLEQSGRTD